MNGIKTFCINLKTMGKRSPNNIKLKQWKIKKCQKIDEKPINV